ncbi:DUF2484 family protein [Shimia abyssi]|uniref:Uncharacterized protein DUF2484 n=1 Tax=Shimia abyssi TaxID=1662395 RepID=A0A2P8FJN6_9RHOB|nr:DUF2484 family protein [Shimia abyssi]PSL21932.1 uncharacterized protein DUF2484 [Shimia abyssi]
MTLSLTLALIWLLVANLRAMFPSKDHLWTFAYVMIAIGVPILIGVAVQNGIWMALLILLMAAWVMRWPVLYLWRWIRARVG